MGVVFLSIPPTHPMSVAGSIAYLPQEVAPQLTLLQVCVDVQS